MATKLWKPLVELLTVATGVVALFVAWIAFEHSRTQAEYQREREEAAAKRERLLWDHSVSIGWGLNKEDGFYISLYNNGPGPAKLKWLQVFYGSLRIASWDEFYSAALGPPRTVERVFSMIYPEEVIPVHEPGGAKFLLRERSTAAADLLRASNDLHIVACVCSLLGECGLRGMSQNPDQVTKLLATQTSDCDFESNYPRYFVVPPSYRDHSPLSD